MKNEKLGREKRSPLGAILCNEGVTPFFGVWSMNILETGEWIYLQSWI